ncbi:N(6)-L-threonylcarbamoyladenine synthase, TsaE subunit [Candidatus Nitrotoga sp. BS]|uniref:tRNA (adenosine(37)-N6)-threonylcarbamoyltransferase complex ATPase subunit type 1 TsaE n=1 Tax=Candidatus Nitrotoga sp. BS TaxID=2890408 RepID=UPI001EF289C6|nr:tRNA (adenosine(37)-N6)-threonylcarbamoyltransferase complex ATPase subunit type 1 TsaE [Candidatus Nitrotoga sp. BS]CAH1199868.1 N(6)-L-threonylcarbamoyladenine synthase, TsaE subunit [Candidatus Nitrotoga sp. BS]
MHNQNNSRISLPLDDEVATVAFAARLAPGIKPGMVIYLHGDLGVGKTTFVRALLHAMGYIGRVKSPTYTLLELYQAGGLHLCHFDLYRFHDADEWDDAGFRDEFDGRNVHLVEWPEKAQDLLPQADMEITIKILSTETMCNGRNIEVRAISQMGKECLETLQS